MVCFAISEILILPSDVNSNSSVCQDLDKIQTEFKLWHYLNPDLNIATFHPSLIMQVALVSNL